MCGRYLVITEDEIIEMKSILEELNQRFSDTGGRFSIAGRTPGEETEVVPSLVAPVLVAKEGRCVLESMKWGFPRWDGKGSIINVGSVSAHIAYKVLPAVAHMAAKGGVVAMSKQIAMEGGKHKIRCNTISPGLVETAQTRAFINTPEWFGPMSDKLMLGRVGQPEDIAPLAVYLASDESSWVTAADFSIDGGSTGW